MSSSGYTLAHPADLDGETSYTFTCGKIDAGIAVLIGSHAHLIEFPSLLLPPGCEPGSIVSITCARDHAAEKAQADSFWDLQTKIVNQFGMESPKSPNLRLRSVTQTSVTLEWDKLELAQCKLLSLSMWKNGQRLGTLPNPTNNTSTKVSGLDLDTEYTFHLVMKTSGGTFNSQKVTVKTHSLNDTSGINVCFGIILPEELHEQAKEALEQLNGRWSDKIQIDTTHFVCTMAYHPQHAQSKTSQPNVSPSLSYQRALQLSIPVVQPSWLLACLHERKMVPIAAHYLGVQPPPLSSTPSTASSAGGMGRPRSTSKVAMPSSNSFSPKNIGVESSSSSNSGKVDQRHERTMSAPENPVLAQITSGRLPDQVERPAVPSLSAIAESSKDTDPSIAHQAPEEVDGLENVDLKSAASQESMRRSNSNTMNESDSEKTFKLGPTSLPSSSVDQPHLPAPPTASNLSDILKENVDSPPENEGNGSNPPPFTSNTRDLVPDPSKTLIGNSSKANEETSKMTASSSMEATLTNSTNVKSSTNGGHSSDAMMNDDADDDPFSAASPTMSNPSPSIDETNFSHRLSLNNHQILSSLYLAPESSSPTLLPTTQEESSIDADNPSSASTMATTKENIQSRHAEDDNATPVPHSNLTSTPLIPSSLSPATNENSTEIFEDVLQNSSLEEPDGKSEDNDNHREEAEDDGIGNSKGESGSGDTFFSTAESFNPSVPNHQTSKLINLDPSSPSTSHHQPNDDDLMDNIEL